MAQAPAVAPQPSSSGPADHGGSHARAHRSGNFWTLALGSIGVVFGDIGTSPLYALRLSLEHVPHNAATWRGDVIGIVSLIFWALILIVTVKYVFVLLRLDNKGEGGTLPLMAVAQRALGRRTALLFVLGMLGAALFYGDALITPAMSVLSAVEGLKAVPGFSGRINPFILPISIFILVALFLLQSRGTHRVGTWFGPITLVWFLVLGGLGLFHLRDDPGIAAALSPLPAFAFMLQHGFLGSMRIWAISAGARSAASGYSWYCRA
jgi:KUP system potassium uptake protein